MRALEEQPNLARRHVERAATPERAVFVVVLPGTVTDRAPLSMPALGVVKLRLNRRSRLLDNRRDAVPHPARGGRPIGQRFRPALKVTVTPATEGPTRDAQLLQRAPRRQVRLLDYP